MTQTIDPTDELAAFLRSRRARLNPFDVGLPIRRQARRTPGLRREEVAELAGISVDYVVRLEQGRGLRPSAEVVEALARALRLAPEERAYLFDLARQRPGSAAEPAVGPAQPLARLVADLSPAPAMLLNHRADILAWNDEMAALLLDFDTLPPQRRNAMWLCVLRPEMRDFYVDRGRVVREAAAHMRAAWAAHPDDQALSALIGELTTDEDFARRWAEQHVKVNGRGLKALRHPRAGLVTMHYETLAPLEDSGQRVVICRPADQASRSALGRLHGGTGADDVLVHRRRPQPAIGKMPPSGRRSTPN